MEGPIKIVLSFDPLPPNFEASVTVSLAIPFVGWVEVGKVGGSLREGIGPHIGYPGILFGSVKLGIDDKGIFVMLIAQAFGQNFDHTWHVPLPSASQKNTDGNVHEMAKLYLGTSNVQVLDIPRPSLLCFSFRELHGAQIVTLPRKKNSWCVRRYFMVKADLTALHEADYDVGPFHIRLQYETGIPYTASIEVNADVPFVGNVVLASGKGNLISGMTMDIGKPPWVGGSVTAKLKRRDTQLMLSVILVASLIGQDWDHEWEVPFPF